MNGYDIYIKSIKNSQEDKFCSGIAPCDDCKDFIKCGVNSFACDAFSEYVSSPSGRWRISSRKNPTNKIFLRVMREEEIKNV